jgi:hypothetical protein
MTTSKDEIQCPVCGTQVALGVNVCPNCGTKLDDGKGKTPQATAGSVVSVANSIQMLMEMAREQEQAGNLQGALDAYRRARAFGVDHQGNDSTVKVMIQMLDSLIQRMEELLKKQPANPAAPVAAQLYRDDYSSGGMPPQAGGSTPPARKSNMVRWIVALLLVGMLCLLLVVVGGGLTYFGIKGQGPLAGLATDTPTRTPTPTATPLPRVLYTTFEGGNGAHGNMFDIYAYNDLTITGFDLNVDSFGSETVEIWYRSGSYYGYESSSSYWTLLAVVNVIGEGSGNPTHVNVDPFHIQEGQSYGLYIWLDSGTSGGIDYSDGTEVYSNSDLQITSGTGNGADWGSVYQPRIWNGAIYYQPGN